VDSLDMLFKAASDRKVRGCGVSFLDSADDVLQLALQYLHLIPTSDASPISSRGAARHVGPPFIASSTRAITSISWRATSCASRGWSSELLNRRAALARRRPRPALAFTLPREVRMSPTTPSDPDWAPHPQAAHEFINFILEPHVIADITNDIHYGNDNLAARPS